MCLLAGLSRHLFQPEILLIFLALLNMTAPSQSDPSPPAASTAAHNAVTLELAKKESAEHMHGMAELFESMQKRPLRIKAYPLNQGHCTGAHTTTTTSASNNSSTIKTVHFVRHGQGFHNLMADLAQEQGRQWKQFAHDDVNNPYIMPEILDAPLTEKGRQQALLLQPVVQSLQEQPQLVVLSPNCRALQTGVIAFDHLLWKDQQQRVVPFLAHEMAREETGVHICDKRRPTDQQAREFPQVNFSLLTSNEDPLYRADARETKAAVGERIYQFMEWLAQRPEEHVAVTSHSGWLLTVFNGVCECSDSQLREWFHTGELRSVKLEFIWINKNP